MANPYEFQMRAVRRGREGSLEIVLSADSKGRIVLANCYFYPDDNEGAYNRSMSYGMSTLRAALERGIVVTDRQHTTFGKEDAEMALLWLDSTILGL